MHQELIDELLKFSREHDLYFISDFDDTRKVYRFAFQNRARTCAYWREISQQQLDLFNGSTVYFANGIINDIQKHIGRR